MTAEPPVQPLPPRGSRTSSSLEKRKPKRWLKWLLFITGVLLLIGIAIGVRIFMQADKAIEEMYDGAEDQRDVPKEELAKEKPISILILGVDNRPATRSLNTDVIMVAALNPETKTAKFASLPRDTYTQPSGWTEGKANRYYARLHNKDDLPGTFNEVKKIYGEIFEIPIDYTVVIDFHTFERIIDELGGIDVYVDQDMRYVDPTDGTNINLSQGQQLLDGAKALDFVRYRYSNRGETRESSDFERNVRQQRVISAIIEKLISLDAIAKSGELFKAVGENVSTDIPPKQFYSLVQTYATSMTSDRMHFMAIEGIWDGKYVQPNQEQFADVKLQLREQLTVAESKS